MNKDITVTLNEKSHKHAEMMIHKAANPEFVVIARVNFDNMQWFKASANDWYTYDECLLCHPNHEKECLHSLNGGEVEFRVVGNEEWSDHPSFKEPTLHTSFMQEDIEFRIKQEPEQEPEYVKVESMFDLSKGERYYTRERSGDYLSIHEHATEDWILLQLNRGGLYRKVDQGE